MKFLSFSLLSILSFTTQACMFPPKGLIEEHNNQFDLLILFSILVAVISLLIRFSHQKSRLWVTALLVLGFGYFPFILFNLDSYGIIGPGGACGRPGMVLIGQICLGGYLVILCYELFKYLKFRRKL
ncbi:hypothetical protein [Pseudoalteromonas sp. NZS37]|uniref:hypothetical protein n=1 Tax=Pseudoalteromonas sp. NZS37 TaxID=2792071 RepID=UPI0018CD438D|nr:hypothetical protein [Pseudoalteromonas sp. NZS37]MBG9993328.1 hypothetical protein [Pseudoalteromonas sp. NZS37]